MITTERLAEIEAAPREASILKAEAKELADAYRERVTNLRVTMGVLDRNMVWTPVSSPPTTTSQEYEWPRYEPVLGITKHGRIHVVAYEQVDEDCEPTWRTACSERWDVTDDITHWMNLPQPPNAI